MRQHMQDVVDINGHAIRERTTRSLRAAFIADDRRSRELAQHLISELSTRSAQQKGRARTVSSKRILLVDDYPDALEIWGLYLRSVGYDVATAADGLEAVERAHALLPDIIVLDLELPGITGFEAAVRLRQAPDTQHIPLIAATGYSHLKQLDHARYVGFDSIVVKPCEPAALVAEIERLLRVAETHGRGQTTAVQRLYQNR